MKKPFVTPKSLKISKHFTFMSGCEEPRLAFKHGVSRINMSDARAKMLSVEKWVIVRDYLSMKHPKPLPRWKIHTGAKYTCGFCVKYNNQRHFNDCRGCPVYARTGERFCEGTPHEAFLDNPSVETAQAEIDFLLSIDVPRAEDEVDPRERVKRERGGPE